MTDLIGLGKEKIEDMMRKSGLIPEQRTKIGDYDLFIADGFSEPPHRHFRRFGIEEKDFPSGMYVTFWWLMKGEKRHFLAHPLFFEKNHNPEYTDPIVRKRSRINAAIADAKGMVSTMRH